MGYFIPGQSVPNWRTRPASGGAGKTCDENPVFALQDGIPASDTNGLAYAREKDWLVIIQDPKR